MDKFIKQNNNILKTENNIISSIKDKKKYNIIKLDNDLEIFLIEDKNLKQSSALMNVNVGSIDNYNNKLGIAHFIEHMLFLGSKKYPTSKYYQSFIESNGGYSNAYTSVKNTAYYFTINSDYFFNALEIFSQFFIDPLFDKKYVKSEVENINSEHEKNKNQDLWRINELSKKIFNNNHPFTKFFTGNNKTLLEKSQKKDVDVLYNLLKKFHTNFYCSNNMKLFIIHNNINKKFIEKIKTIFSMIKNNKNIIRINNNENLFNSLNNKIYYASYIPINKIENLQLYWVIPYNNNLNENKLFDNISFYIINKILKNSYEESIYKTLINKNLCLDLDIDYDFNIDNNTIFKIGIELTDNGSKNKNLIINIILSFFNYLINNFDSLIDKFEYLVDEILILKKFNFKNNLESGLEKLENLSYIYNDFNLDLNLLNAKSILYENKNLIKNFKSTLNNFKLKNFFIIDISKNNKLNNKKIDENYNFKYSIEEKLFNYEYVDLNYQSFIPKKNILIDENCLKIKLKNSKNDIKKLKNKHNIYYKCNNSYNKDLCYIVLNFKYYDIKNNKNIEYYLSLLIYINYIYFHFSNEFYHINNSLNSIKINTSDNETLHIFIKCENNNLSYIINFLNDLLNKNIIEIDNDIFYNNILKSIIDNIDNNIYLPCYKKINMLITEKLQNKCLFTTLECKNYLNKIKKNNIKNNILKIKNNVNIIGFICGNIDENLLNKSINNFVNNYNFKEIKNFECFKFKKEINDKNLIKNDNNICIKLLFYTDSVIINVTKDWKKKQILNSLLEIIINKLFYNDIRTEQKIGYIAKVKNQTFLSNGKKLFFLSFLVQSTKYKKNVLKDKILKSIKKIYNYLNNNFTDENFINSKLGYLSLLNNLTENDIYDDLDFYISLIENIKHNEKPIFNLISLLKKELVGNNIKLNSNIDLLNKGIKKNDVIEYFNKVYLNSKYITAVID